MLKKQSPAIKYLITIGFIDSLGLGMVITLFPKLFLNPWSNILSNKLPYNIHVFLLSIFLAIYPLFQFFGAPFWGHLSDQHGRKAILSLTLTGTSLGFLLAAISINSENIILLFFARMLAGFFAGNISVVHASMLDISTPKNRKHNISILQITFGLSWIIGPPLGGWLSQVRELNDSAPFWVMFILLIATTMLTILRYKDTLKQDTQPSHLHIHKKIFITNFLKNPLLIILSTWATFTSGWWLFEAYLPTYLQQHWAYSPPTIGSYLGFMGSIYVITQLISLKILSKLSLSNTISLTLPSLGIFLIWIILNHSSFALITALTLYAISMAFALPGLITSISNAAPPHKQGYIMGLTSGIQSLTTVSMILIGGELFIINEKLPITVSSFLFLLSWILFLLYGNCHKKIKSF